MNFNTFTPIHLAKTKNEREEKDILFVVEKTKDLHGGEELQCGGKSCIMVD
jgi:hypothetical protein